MLEQFKTIHTYNGDYDIDGISCAFIEAAVTLPGLTAEQVAENPYDLFPQNDESAKDCSYVYKNSKSHILLSVNTEQ